MKHRTNIFKILIATVTLILANLLFLATPKNNVNAASGDDSTGISAPDGCPSTWHYCSSWGAGWHYQTFDDFKNWSPANSSTAEGSINKEYIINKCINDGGTGVYRLSYERSNNSGASFVPNQFAGLLKVRTGLSVYQHELEGVEDWSQTALKWADAEAHGATEPGLGWNDTSWFCYNPSWSCTPGDPECPETPTATTADSHFYATSTVTTPAGAIGGSAKSITSNADGSVTVYFSTDQPSITVNFSHTIAYQNNNYHPGTSDKLVDNHGSTDSTSEDNAHDKISTKWSISGETSASGKEDDYTVTASDTSDSSTPTETNGSKTVNLNPGDEIKVCSIISYNDKNFTFDGKDHITQSRKDPVYNEITGALITAGRSEIKHKDYVASSSGNGSSSACAVITRPKDPGGDPDSENPTVVGNTASTITYAGETVSIKWNTSATGVATRRLAASQLSSHLFTASTAYSSINSTAQTRAASWQSPYVFLGGEAKSVEKSVEDLNSGNIAYESWNTNANEGNYYTSRLLAKYGIEKKLKVPNEVGDKICASAGYKFEYWWGVDYGGGIDWNKDDGRDYWYIFKPSCRTIAKKPSVAVWNGGIFTTGNILTSISDRFNSVTFGEIASGDQTKFGSWSEFLTVAGGSIRDGATEFASGSVLYNESNSRDNLYPLTIANSDSGDPGHSGIDANQTLKTRLESYLKNRAPGGIEDNKVKDEAKWKNVNSTNIYSISGPLSIEGDITTLSGIYTSIYDIPQVVIFVDGDVNIDSNVQRIDAWIIATGQINTCINHEKPNIDAGKYGTEADPSGRKNTDVCTNQLIFNGPIMAGSIALNRSFGSDPSAGTGYGAGARYGASLTDSTTMSSSKQAPAEIFNLRADTYLWAYAQSTRYDSSFTESYSRELAPRY